MRKTTLDSVQADFQQWRCNKLNPKERTPEHLKQKAVTLLSDLPVGKITKALGISSQMLNSWTDSAVNVPVAKKPIKFVTLTENHQAAPPNISGLKLDVTEPNGKLWCLQGDVTTAQMEIFIRSIGGQS